jgi:hypothetical protein
MVWHYWAIAITRYRTAGCSRDDVLGTYLGREKLVCTYVDVGTETVLCPGTVMDIKHRINLFFFRCQSFH